MTWSSSILGWMLDASWPCRFDSELYRFPMVSCLTSALAKCHVGIGENDHVKPAGKVVQKIKRKRIRNSIQKWAAVYGPLEITFQPLLSQGLVISCILSNLPNTTTLKLSQTIYHPCFTDKIDIDWQQNQAGVACDLRPASWSPWCWLDAASPASVTLKLRHSFDKARLWSGSAANAPGDMHRRSLPRRQGRWHPHRWCPNSI